MPFIALEGDLTDPKFGPAGIVTEGASTVLIEGRRVAAVGSGISIHGNPFDPRRAGFNPICAHTKILTGINNILVEGKPIAVIGSLCDCGLHSMTTGTAVTVQVGG